MDLHPQFYYTSVLLTVRHLVNPSCMNKSRPCSLRLAGRLQLFYHLSRPQRRFTFVDMFLQIVSEPGAIGTREP